VTGTTRLLLFQLMDPPATDLVEGVEERVRGAYGHQQPGLRHSE
jgi:hypothetical protein